MKLADHFNSFLKNEVNLNQSRIDQLVSRVAAIEDFLRVSSFSDNIRRVVPQGSWQHRTIIKPPGSKEFDADLAVLLDPIDDWESAQYIDGLYEAFRAHGTYREMVHRKTRCVTIDYAGDFHLDIAPIVVRGFLRELKYAQNRLTNEEEETEPEGYNDWFGEKNAYTGNNMLVKVTRLLKYLRDIKRTFALRSILLATLLGNKVRSGFLLGDDTSECYPDVPTALVTILDRLDEYLQEHENVPDIFNPALSDEVFSANWDAASYSVFRERIHLYRSGADEAYAEADRLASIAKWRRVFGEQFCAGVAASFRSSSNDFLPAAQHERSSKWPLEIRAKADVHAAVYDSKKNQRLGSLNSRGRKIRKGLYLRFSVQTAVDPPFEAWWQVVNTGREAEVAGQLRGGFYEADDGTGRWEYTKYQGCHWVRCYIVERGICVATSKRFIVNIA